MCYNFEFDHLVVFTKDRTIFGSGKELNTGKAKLFLAFDDGEGNVYSRNGLASSWCELTGSDAEFVRNKIGVARNNHIPVYTINGSHN